MFINCGKAVQMLCFRSDLPAHRSVERKRQVSRQWNNTQISTISSQITHIVFHLFYRHSTPV